MLTRHHGTEVEKMLIQISQVFWKASDDKSKCGVTAIRPPEVIWAVSVDKTMEMRTKSWPSASRWRGNK